MSPLPVLLTIVIAATPAGDEGGPGPPGPHEERRDLVVLLHGMGRTSRSMRPLERALVHDGYRVLNYGYRSRRGRVADHGAALLDRIERDMDREDPGHIHFVGHSLGNIVIRWSLAHGADRLGRDRIGRVVMLAPPNGGSRRADQVVRWMSWLSKPLHDLTTAPDSTARTIHPLDGVPIGVIAGSRDPIVSVEESRLAEMAEHIVVPSGHTFIMRRDLVIDLTKRFLDRGTFTEPD